LLLVVAVLTLVEPAITAPRPPVFRGGQFAIPDVPVVPAAP
jgi:hypothetical protein